MPDRIVRDELLTSARYWAVSIEAQRLFIHLILVADNLSRFSGKNYTIRAACYPGQAIDPDKLEKWLAELADVDLIRLYHQPVDNIQERYIFIPRSRQRLRYRSSKFPTPPAQINDIDSEKSDHGLTTDRPQSGYSQTVDARREVKRSKPYAQAPVDKWWTTDQGIEAKGRELGIPAKGGESYAQYRDRLFASLKAKA